MSTNKLWSGVWLLFIAGLVGKVISAFYRVPLQNLTGDTGFYIYQQIYPILGTATILALYGFPSAIAQLYAEHPGEGKNKGLYGRIFIVLSVFSVLVFGLLYSLSPVFSSWMKDDTIATVMRQSVWVFLIVPITALLRGVFQARGRWEYFAGSQVIEQVARATIIVITAILIWYGGIGLMSIGAGAALGSMLGLLLAAIYLLVHSSKLDVIGGSNTNTLPYRQIISSIIGSGLIISMNHMLLLLMQMADAFTVVPGLLKMGISLSEATEWKGIVDRGQPLLQLVTITGSSIVIALVPSLTKHHLLTERTKTIQMIQRAVNYCLYISVGATAGLIVLMPEVNELLFQDKQGIIPLRILSLSLLFSPVIIVLAQVLQGFGYRKIIAMIFFVGLWLKVLFNNWLTPQFATAGNALATVITLFFIILSLGYLLYRLLSKERSIPFSIKWGRMLLSVFSMIIILLIVRWINIIHYVDNRLLMLIYVMVNVGLGALVYGLALYRLNVLTKEDIKLVIGSRKER